MKMEHRFHIECLWPLGIISIFMGNLRFQQSPDSSNFGKCQSHYCDDLRCHRTDASAVFQLPKNSVPGLSRACCGWQSYLHNFHGLGENYPRSFTAHKSRIFANFGTSVDNFGLSLVIHLAPRLFFSYSSGGNSHVDPLTIRTHGLRNRGTGPERTDRTGSP